MFVIGTSGHIDHGKTTLIQALTGIDCDRLPEEKEREMTIDIGFAHMELPRFGTVSFIDVPGHERFIRNMVAGAWGVDLGLLVVAADDGWMPQTEDHFSVLELLGIERIIAAIAKIDLADESRIGAAERQVRDRLAGTPYEGSDIVRVSARTGEGIDILKKTIETNLDRLSGIRNADKPFMYVDRVFAPKGHGTVVTGTLRNGVLHENDVVFLHPGRREARVKRIESHYHAEAEGAPSRRTALNISGVQSESIERGHILFRNDFFTPSREILARIRMLDPKREPRNNMGVEVLIGTASVRGRLHTMKGGKQNPSWSPVRIAFDEPWYCYPGQPFVLTGPGAYRILGGGSVLLPAYDRKAQRDRAIEGLLRFPSFSREDLLSFIIAARRWMKRSDARSMFPEGDKDIDSLMDSLEKRGAVVFLGEYVMDGRDREVLEKGILEAVGKSVGPNIREIADLAGVDGDIARLFLESLRKKGLVVEKGGKFFPGGHDAGEGLSKGKKAVLDLALSKKGEGIELDKLANDMMKKDARELVRLDLLVSLDANIVYHRTVYDEMTGKILALFDKKEKITVPEAKEAVGLSRKYILPLLNRIERDGLIKRLGDFRVKS